MHGHRVDTERLQRSVRQFGENWTRDAVDMRSYLASQVGDTSQREVLGPLLNASGASGVVRVDGHEVAAWGDPEVPEMAFSVTKTVVSIVAGLAFDDGLLRPDQQVHAVVDAPESMAPRTGRGARGNGGRHLLWVDPTRSLVLASHWTECPAGLISTVSESVTPGGRPYLGEDPRDR